MILQQTFYKCLCAGKRKRVPEAASIKSAAAFQAILAKERARVDRNSHVFSLVAFEVGPQDSCMDSIHNFVCQLKKQIRITDEIGWLDNGTIGVLLFNSLNDEARIFIEKIKRNCSPNILCKCSISTYPEDMVEHPHNEGVHKELGNSCHHSIPGSTSLHDHHKTTDEQIGLRLQPVFFDSMSVWKRLADIIVSSIALVVLSPLLVAIAIAVKITSKGPVFFNHKRAGLGGVPFRFLKYRTMRVDAEEKKSELLQFNERTGPVFKMENDPRVTRLGMFLRKWSLDELPQFVNVFMGDMSLVGPRPPTLDEVEQYESWHNYRLELKPGITCIWQVYARHEKSFENWVRLDIKYRQKQSFLFDMKLLALTLPAVLSRRGAS
jgi:lipopolysaccharide/colanic/teichoic acid biosynthesis glycosyltransferase